MREKEKKSNSVWIFVTIFVLIILDQFFKIMVVLNQENLPICLIQNVLSLNYVENTGGAFGIGNNNVMMFIITEFIVLGIIIRFMMLQNDTMDRKTKIALSLVLAGGFSNLIDRVIKGRVIDFIQIDLFHFPLFNLADIVIVIGWISFLAFMASYTVKVKREMRKQKEKIEDQRRDYFEEDHRDGK